ncbi:MAG: helix-turn-helix domain-containing protein [Bdellovibrionia bacterium]
MKNHEVKKRGRPKGFSRDKRSFGPLGDLLRSARLSKRMGLADVADSCGFSVQFLSNIEHGRAPLPWDKIEQVSKVLGILVSDLQVANLTIRADFKSFVGSARGRRVAKPAILTGAASAVALSAGDSALQEIIQKYRLASPVSRQKFLSLAMEMLAN